MGAGASAVEKKDYSVDELAAFAKSLNPEDFKKVQNALETARSNGGYMESPAAAAPNDSEGNTLTIEYSDDWEEQMEGKLMEFAMGINASPGTHDCQVFTAQGREIDGPEGITADAFPLKAKFVLKEGAVPGDPEAAFKFMATMNEFLEKKKAEAAGALNEASDSAPFLREYFQTSFKFQSENMPDMDKMMEIAFDPEAQEKIKKQAKDFFNNVGKPILVKSFKKHDKDDSGTMCKEEAAVFFKNMSGETALFAQAMAALTMAATMQTCIAMMAEMMQSAAPGEGEVKEMTDDMKKTISQQLEELKTQMDALKQAYVDDAEARNAEAFKVLDTSGDGTIQLEEFLEVFDPDTERFTKFTGALGMVPPTPEPPAGGDECSIM